MNLVELENVSGPRVKRGARLKKTLATGPRRMIVARRSADAEIAVRGIPCLVERVRKVRTGSRSKSEIYFAKAAKHVDLFI